MHVVRPRQRYEVVDIEQRDHEESVRTLGEESCGFRETLALCLGLPHHLLMIGGEPGAIRKT